MRGWVVSGNPITLIGPDLVSGHRSSEYSAAHRLALFVTHRQFHFNFGSGYEAHSGEMYEVETRISHMIVLCLRFTYTSYFTNCPICCSLLQPITRQ